jgi:hypothetical protein
MPSELDDILDNIKWYNKWTQRIYVANLAILIAVLIFLLTRLLG